MIKKIFFSRFGGMTEAFLGFPLFAFLVLAIESEVCFKQERLIVFLLFSVGYFLIFATAFALYAVLDIVCYLITGHTTGAYKRKFQKAYYVALYESAREKYNTLRELYYSDAFSEKHVIGYCIKNNISSKQYRSITKLHNEQNIYVYEKLVQLHL